MKRFEKSLCPGRSPKSVSEENLHFTELRVDPIEVRFGRTLFGYQRVIMA